jgi:serine/threonine protein kinase
MNRYKVTKQLGDGTYGSVLKAVNRQSGEVVRCMWAGAARKVVAMAWRLTSACAFRWRSSA